MCWQMMYISPVGNAAAVYCTPSITTAVKIALSSEEREKDKRHLMTDLHETRLSSSTEWPAWDGGLFGHSQPFFPH